MNHNYMTTTFNSSGLRLNYVEWGKKKSRPIVLLHGIQDCARSWDFFASTLSDNFHVIALDHRGHGDSEWASPSQYRLADYIKDVEHLVGHLGLSDVLLIGHGSGGRNALKYTVTHPQIVTSLIMLDVDPNGSNPAYMNMIKQYQSESDEWDSLNDVIEHLRKRQPNSTDEMLEHQALQMTTPLSNSGRIWKRDRRSLEANETSDLWNEWSQIESPTLILRGRQSKIFKHDVAIKMRESIPTARLVELEGAGHWLYQEIASAFEDVVHWFLQNP